MRRTQLYLDDDLWSTLHSQARQQGTTISDLVRKAVRDRYLGNLEKRRQAMEAIIGIRRTSAAEPDSTELIRGLRRGSRMQRLESK